MLRAGARGRCCFSSRENGHAARTPAGAIERSTQNSVKPAAHELARDLRVRRLMAMRTTIGGGKAQRIELLRVDTPPMRAFHVTWVAFCVAFFAWFAVAPLTPVIREELDLTPADLSNAMMASVAATVFARVVVGFLCDRMGPRRVYTWLLLVSFVPVISVAFVQDAASFIAARLAIGIVGAAFVVTQYHMSLMFAPRVLGAANAITAGWGNLGGGLAQVVMPSLFGAAVALGLSENAAWRASLLLPGILLLLAALAYWRYTWDTPTGNWQHPPTPASSPVTEDKWGKLRIAVADVRTWVLAIAYGICFGVELTMHNAAPLYLVDRFGLSLKQAGLLAGMVGLANIFARAVGGMASDLAARVLGLHGRVYVLFAVLLVEGVALAIFGYASTLPVAVVALVVFALFVNFSTGATFGLVPFLHPQAVGAVSGIVAAGGNVGAVLAALLFRGEGSLASGLFQLGTLVALLCPLVLLVRFSAVEQRAHLSEVRGRWLASVPNPKEAEGAVPAQ
ncbi:Nitrate transporter [bacterium HR30]|nr:Nitrate transporter [bacterium HR30]